MRTLGSLLVLLSVLFYFFIEIEVTWIRLIGVIGVIIMVYDYWYVVFPSIFNDDKICPYCDGKLWIDDQSGNFYCKNCNRYL